MRNTKKAPKYRNQKLIAIILLTGIIVATSIYFLKPTKPSLKACNSNKQIFAAAKGSLELNCGDTLILSATFKGSTGYEPFTPVFDSSLFELTGYTDSDKGNDMPGGDGITRTYTFKSLQRTASSKIEVGIHRPWDPTNLKQIQQTVAVIVL